MPSLPIRIAFCHHSADVGGGSDRSLFELVLALPRDRFRVLLVLRNGDPMAPSYRASGIEVFETPLVSPRRSGNPLHTLRFALNWPLAARRIAHAVREFDAQVVHVNTLTNAQGALAARWARLPLVWHVRELMPGSRGYRALLWLARRWAKRIVAISSAVAAAIGNRPGVCLVPNGVDLARCRSGRNRAEARRALGFEPETPVVVLIGRLEPWKGQHVLVEAAPAILARHPNATLLLVGSPAVNKPGYAQALAARCRTLGVAHAVRFLGQRGDVAEILAAASVVVSCSVTPEPFGRTLVEAMAAGRAVVASRGGGPEDILEDTVSGLLVPPGEPAALADAVCDLLEDPVRAEALAEAGRARAEARYSIARLAEDMARLFEELA
jgi:glycosyltransferase involved in cell wall biosynthesis